METSFDGQLTSVIAAWHHKSFSEMFQTRNSLLDRIRDKTILDAQPKSPIEALCDAARILVLRGDNDV